MKLLIAITVILAMTGIAMAWPMDNGTVMLGEINISLFDEPTMQDVGISGGAGVIGPTLGQLRFAADNDKDGKPLGNASKKTPLRCGGM